MGTKCRRGNSYALRCGGTGRPFHSQTNEAWFTKTPGLKVIYPAFPYDAKGLLATAVNDPNPVLFFEHKALYRSVYQDVPTAYYTLPFGKASLLREGGDVSIVTYGAGVHWGAGNTGKASGCKCRSYRSAYVDAFRPPKHLRFRQEDRETDYFTGG